MTAEPSFCANCGSQRHRECCARCGKTVPTRRRATGFCTQRCADAQAHDDATSAEQENEMRYRQTPMQKVREPSPDLVRASSLRNERQHDASPSARAARRAGHRAMLKLTRGWGLAESSPGAHA